MICASLSHRDVAHSIPTTVAEGVLIGATDAAANRYAMRHYGVTHILSLGSVSAPEWPQAATLLEEARLYHLCDSEESLSPPCRT